jgi:hypothetical protein
MEICKLYGWVNESNLECYFSFFILPTLFNDNYCIMLYIIIYSVRYETSYKFVYPHNRCNNIVNNIWVC